MIRTSRYIIWNFYPEFYYMIHDLSLCHPNLSFYHPGSSLDHPEMVSFKRIVTMLTSSAPLPWLSADVTPFPFTPLRICHPVFFIWRNIIPMEVSNVQWDIETLPQRNNLIWKDKSETGAKYILNDDRTDHERPWTIAWFKLLLQSHFILWTFSLFYVSWYMPMFYFS